MTTTYKPIEFLRVAHLRGPNIWTYRPVIEAWLDLGALEQAPSNQIAGLYERLLAALPGLAQHRCGIGEVGGFLQRLQEGTWAGHILEHVVLELQNMAGMRTGFGQTRSTNVVGVYKMAFRTRQEQVGRAALQLGRDVLMAAINDTPYDLASAIDQLKEMVDDLCLGPSTAHIVDAATDRRIPSIRLNTGNLVQLGHGAAQRRIWTAETDRTSAIAEGIASDKDLTKSLLKSCGVPVPEGSLVHSAEEAWDEAQDIGLPVVIKPYDGNHGRGVSLNLMSEADVHAAYHLAARKGDSNSVIVERFVTGNEHRILVVGDRVVAAAKGEALWVTGDGHANIIALCDSQINTDPRRGTTEDDPLNIVEPHNNGEVLLELKRQNLDPYSVPLAGQKVLIQTNGNVAFDVTDQVHPEVARIAVLAARVVGLDIAGIDLVADNIAEPLDAQGGAIIEVNASPGLLAHLKPASGMPRPIGAAIIHHLFGEQNDGRIPIIGVAGSQGTSLIARLIANIVTMSGKYVGVACQQGLFLDQRQVQKNDCANWNDSQNLLLNRSLQTAVFETNAKMILTDGLAYDKCVVGVVTDMEGADQLGEFYISQAEHMFKIMRSQVDVILPHGCAVLNANYPQVAELAELCDGRVIFYGLDANNDNIVQHREQGERVVFLRDQQIVLAEGADEISAIPLSTLKPSKASQPASVMAAVAAAWALGISSELISAGLRTFNSDTIASIN